MLQTHAVYVTHPRFNSQGYELGLLVSHTDAAVLTSCVVQDAHHSRLVLDES